MFNYNTNNTRRMRIKIKFKINKLNYLWREESDCQFFSYIPEFPIFLSYIKGSEIRSNFFISLA